MNNFVINIVLTSLTFFISIAVLFVEPEVKKNLYAIILGLWLSFLIHLIFRDFP